MMSIAEACHAVTVCNLPMCLVVGNAVYRVAFGFGHWAVDYDAVGELPNRAYGALVDAWLGVGVDWAGRGTVPEALGLCRANAKFGGCRPTEFHFDCRVSKHIKVKASEAAIASATLIEARLTQAADTFHALNTRLLELQALIKTAQPKASGAVCLELYSCGPGCTGCPHPRWVRYHWTEGSPTTAGRLVCQNLDVRKKEPVSVLAKKFPNYAQTVVLIREAKTILKKRAVLLNILRSLHVLTK